MTSLGSISTAGGGNDDFDEGKTGMGVEFLAAYYSFHCIRSRFPPA